MMKKTSGNLTPKSVRFGLNLSLISGVVGNVWMAIALTIPMALFFEALGASGLAIGLLTMLPQVAMIVQVPSTFFIEKKTHRKGFWFVTAMISRVVYFLPALIIFLPENLRSWGVPVLLFTAAVNAFIGQMAVSPWLSWMADLIPDKQRGAYWGKRQAYASAAFLLALAGAGWMLDRFPEGSLTGFSIVFVIATLFGCADLILHFFVPEPPQGRTAPGTPPLKRILAPLKNRDFVFFTLAMASWGFGISMIGQFGNVYLKQVFSLPYTEISFIQIISSIGGISASFLAASLMDRMGARVFAVLMLLIAPLLHVVWLLVIPGATLFGFSQATVFLSITGFLFGGVVAGIIVTQLNLASLLTPNEGRTMAMAVHWSIVGLISAVGPLLGGQLMDWFTAHPNTIDIHLPSGVPFTYLHVLLIFHLLITWFITVPLFLRIKTHSRDIGVSRAVRNVILANPMRVARDLYNIHISMASVPSHRKAKAVYKLGKTRSPMVVADLADLLEDPSTDVREEAVTALGEIGDGEALDILLRTLEDPHQADLAPQIARALRRIRSPKSVDALKKQLGSPDRETKTESVRALGEIADRRVANDLLTILREEQDEKLIGHSSEALARMNEHVAVYEIFPRMRQTENRVLKRSLATAIGTLFGKSDAFYRIFAKELQEPTSEAEKLLRKVKRLTGQSPRNKRHAEEAITLFTSAYEKEAWAHCTEPLLQLAKLIARKDFGKDCSEEINERNWSAGLILWLIENIHAAQNDTLRPVEILLGLYALSCWPTRSDKLDGASH